MIYVKVNDALYPAKVEGRMVDIDWERRESKAITLEGDYETVNALFANGTPWSIVVVDIAHDNEGKETERHTEYDNSVFSVRGDLIVHNDGTCTVKMGKPTAEEDMIAALAVLGVK